MTKAIADVTDAAFARVREELPEESGRIDREWLEGFAGRYYGEARERLIGAQRAAVERLAKQDVTADELLNLMRKLRGWGRDRAGNMARYERVLAMNEALVAGYRASGYTSVWQSAPGCCRICTRLNGRTVTTLKPPLHKGCVCTVKRGEKRLTAEGGSGSIKYNHNADGTIAVTDDWTPRREHLPLKYKAGSVVQTKGSGGQINRAYYGLDADENGEAFLVKQIHSRAHTRTGTSDYANGGMHAHDFKDGERVLYTGGEHGRNVSDDEKKENEDLL